MKITLNPLDFNKIMKVCTPCTKNDVREYLQYIEIVHNGDGIGYASSCDSYTMVQTRFECEGDAGRMLIWPCKPVRTGGTITLRYNNGRSTIDFFGEEVISRKVPLPEQYIDLRKITDDAQSKSKTISMAFNARLLQKMLTACGRQGVVYLDIYGPDEAIVFYSDYRAEGLVLPTVIHGEEHKMPKFYGGEADGI